MNFHLPKQLALLSRITYGKRVHPQRDWLMLLAVAMMLLIVAALWSAVLYARGTHRDTDTQTPVAPTGVSLEALEKTTALFEARAQEEERYRSEYRFVDPKQSNR